MSLARAMRLYVAWVFAALQNLAAAAVLAHRCHSGGARPAANQIVPLPTRAKALQRKRATWSPAPVAARGASMGASMGASLPRGRPLTHGLRGGGSPTDAV